MKKLTHNRIGKQQGFLMIVLVVLIVIVGVMVAVISSMFFDSGSSTSSHYQSDNAFYLAEAGIEHATHKMLQPTIANRRSCTADDASALTNSLGTGGYSVTVADSTSASWPAIYYGGGTFEPAALSAAMTASSTSISVNSTTNYANAGRIMIDKERINYQRRTSTSFTDLTRGVDNTAATAHSSGAQVAQYQCNIVATAGVPSLASPEGRRTVNASVQLQGGWAVGNFTGSGLTYLNFNYPTSENRWTYFVSSGSLNLFATYWLSNVDGWFVGNNYILHWTTFSGINYTPPVNVIYRSIYCNTKNDCHAVGDVRTRQVIIDWNGTTWTRTAATGQNRQNNLRGVHCSSSSDCWAVGDSSGGSVFYRWTGAAPWTGITETLSAYPYNSVFCNAANDCWAVGDNASFARLTGGTAWGNYATGLPAVRYNSIVCNNSADCWAVGNASGSANIFVHWDGNAWSLSSSNPTPTSNLNGIDCFGPDDCWAVGASTSGSNAQLFHWDGTSWTNNTNITGGTLTGVSLNAISLTGRNSTQPMTNWSEPFN